MAVERRCYGKTLDCIEEGGFTHRGAHIAKTKILTGRQK